MHNGPLVLGVDPGTATTGYGLVREHNNGSLEMVDYGVILTPPGLPDATRLMQIYDALGAVIAQHKPTHAAVEKLFFKRNVTTAMTVSQARGVVLLAIAQTGVTPAEYTPNAVKQAVTGYGSAEKGQVQHMVQLLLGLAEIPKPDDAADALAIAICHLHVVNTQSLE